MYSDVASAAAPHFVCTQEFTIQLHSRVLLLIVMQVHWSEKTEAETITRLNKLDYN